MNRLTVTLLALGILASGACSDVAGVEVQAAEPAPAKLLDPEQLDLASTGDLLKHITKDGVTRYFDATGGYEIHWEATRELGRRRADLALLLEAFEQPVDSFQEERVVLAICSIGELEDLSELEDQAIRRTFASERAAEHWSGGVDMVGYKILLRRAQRGEREALGLLNDSYCSWGVPSYEASEAVMLFGKYRFEPAIPNLYRSLDAASLNLGGAAMESMKLLLPGPHPTLRSPALAVAYFGELLEESSPAPDDRSE